MPLTITRGAAFALLLAPASLLAQPGEPPAGGATPAGGKAEFKSFEEKLSYVLGVNTARKMRNDNVEPDPQAFSRGFIDEFGGKSSLSDEEMTAVLQQFSRQLQERAAAAQKELKDKWVASFSDEKKPKDGPKKTKSGLGYDVFEEGKGGKPKATDVAVFHYEGRLAKDGTVFDSSIDNGQPLVYPVERLIPGWTEGLQLMPVGSKYRFYIPAALGYGDQGFPPPGPDVVQRIGPNEDLVFDVQLLQIAPPEETPPAGAPAAPEGDAPK